jgi:hypothetical protein
MAASRERREGTQWRRLEATMEEKRGGGGAGWRQPAGRWWRR